MSSRRKRRIPQCARCRSHNTVASVRGHKRLCQWKDCTCAKCLMVTEKRRVTAVRVAVLRRERKRRMLHRMGLDAFHAGLHAASSRAMMMRQVPETSYPAEQPHVNPSMSLPSDTYCNEVLHMKYRSMYPYYAGQPYYHIHPVAGVHGRDDAQVHQTDSGITKNMESFQHEYESFMLKLNDGELSPSNKTVMMTTRSSSPAYRRVCIQQDSPQHGHLDVYRSPILHENGLHPRSSYDNHKCLPMVMNNLTCSCLKSSAEFPSGFCM